jgi:hypothetical protein
MGSPEVGVALLTSNEYAEYVHSSGADKMQSCAPWQLAFHLEISKQSQNSIVLPSRK